ncbi:hypothetical protein BDR22DRAFT_871703 [Usnea florida]
MDDYYDHVMPATDEGEEFKNLKKRVREGDGSEDEGRPTKRPRANTSALLPPEPEGHHQEINEPPKPEDSLDKYDRARLKLGLRYIDGAAKRKVTPRAEEFLRQYKDAYKVALESESPNEASRAFVQALDKVHYSASFYFKPRSPDELEHLMSFVKLRRLELRANYGDYLGHEASLFRADRKEAAAGAHSENPAVREASSGILGPRQQTAIADDLDINTQDLRTYFFSSCDALGFDADHMLWLIGEWAQRNCTFHNSIRDYISDCEWSRVGEQLCRDLKEVHNVAPDRDTAEKYKRVLLKIRHDYFEALNPDNSFTWLPSEKARKLTHEKWAKDMKKVQKK